MISWLQTNNGQQPQPSDSHYSCQIYVKTSHHFFHNIFDITFLGQNSDWVKTKEFYLKVPGQILATIHQYSSRRVQ